MATTVGNLNVQLGLDSAGFQQSMQQAARSMASFGKQMAKIGAAVSVVGAGIGLAIRGQLNAADDLGKTAQKIGIPVDDLSRLAHAADMSGVSMGSLEGAVSRMSRAMATSPQRFAKLGIALRDANGEMRPTADVMADFAQILADMPDGAEKTALAMEVLGRSGADLIPMLNGGRDALRGMMQEADDLGIVITPDMARNAEAFNDNISRLTKQFSGLWTMITANLAPALVRISDALVGFATRFRNLSPAVQQFVSILAGAIVVIGPVLSGLGLMIMTAGPFVSAMAAVAVAIKGVSLALLANPIGIAVAAIAGAAYLIYREWDAIVPWFQNLWAAVKGAFDGGINSIVGATVQWSRDVIAGFWRGLSALYQAGRDAIHELARGMQESITGLVSDAASWGRDIASGLSNGIKNGAAAVRDSVTGLASNVKGWFTDEVEIQSPSQVFHRFGEFISKGLANGIEAGSGWAQNAVSGLGDSLSNALEGVITKTTTVKEAFANMLQDIASQLARSGVQQLIGGIFGGSGLSIPGFANGVTNFQGGLAMVGERGRELVSLPRGSSVHSNGATERMLQAQGGTGPIEIVLRAPEGFTAQQVSEIQGVSVRVTQSGIDQFARQQLPQWVGRINRNPRDRW